MKFVTPTVEELSYLRANPLLWEQELDVSTQGSGITRTGGRSAGRQNLLALSS